MVLHRRHHVNGPVFASQEASCAQNWLFDDFLNPASAGVWATSAYGVSASGEPLVFFGTADSDSTEYAVDAVTGNRVWYFSVPSPPGDYDIGDGATVSVPGKNGFADGVVYVDSKYGYEYALDLTTGALLWQFGPFAKAGGPGSRSSAAFDGTNLVFGYYIGGASGGVLALSAVSGSLLWNYQTPKEVLSSPAIVGPPGSEVVTFGDLTGVFRMLSLASGSELYAYQTGGYITSSPAEADGKIFIAGSDGFLYAFGRTGGNGSPPASTIGAPVAGSQLPNPNGSLTISGTATDASGVASVEVAVQENGASGPWYDTATGTTNPGPIRNQATLTNPGSTTTNWSLTLPAPAAGGTFAAYASAVNVNNIVNRSTPSSFTILPSLGEPNVTLSATYLPPGASFTASSTAFRPREQVTFSLYGKVVATRTVSANGHVPAATVTIPTGATFGPTSLTLTGLTSGKTTSGTIYVTNNWVEFGHDSAHSALEVHDNVIDESLSIGNGTVLNKSWYYVANAAVNSSPSVVNGIAYFGNDAGVVSAVVVNTGASQWNYATPSGAPIHSAPAIDPNGTVIVASSDGNLYWIGKTGSLMTSLSLGGTLTSPNVDNGQIFVASSTGSLYDVSDSTGTVTWTSPLSAGSSSSPAFDASNNIVVDGDGSGAVTAFNATTGAQLWKVTTGGAVTAAPLIVNGTVYIGSADTDFYAINESTGAVNWKYALTGPIVAAASQLSTSQISIGDSNAMAYAFSTSGALAYSYSLGQKSGPIVGIANVQGGTFFEMAGGLVAMVRVVDKPGNAWHYQTATTLSTSPAIVDGTVYIGAADGGLYAFTPQGANPLDRAKVPVVSITDSNWVCSTP